MDRKQRKAKLKRANQHRLMAKTPEYQANWENRQDKWVEQMKAIGRLVESEESRLEQAKAAISYFVQERERIKREKRIELIKEVIAAILAVVVFVALLVLILCLKWQGFDWLRVRWV